MGKVQFCRTNTQKKVIKKKKVSQVVGIRVCLCVFLSTNRENKIKNKKGVKNIFFLFNNIIFNIILQ